jgi:hypothetical protein
MATLNMSKYVALQRMIIGVVAILASSLGCLLLFLLAMTFIVNILGINESNYEELNLMRARKTLNFLAIIPLLAMAAALLLRAFDFSVKYMFDGFLVLYYGSSVEKHNQLARRNYK